MIKAWSLSLLLATFVAQANSFTDFEELAKQCAPSVSVDTLSAIVKTESSFNPFAIGIVGGDEIKQPQSLQEAVFIATKLATKNKSFSVGLGQINSANFEKLKVTAEELFDPCKNLQAVATILGQCYIAMSSPNKSPEKVLSDALSCYYSGNSKTGYEHGYVDRVISNAPPIQIPSIQLLAKSKSTSTDVDNQNLPLISSGTQVDEARSTLIF